MDNNSNSNKKVRKGDRVIVISGANRGQAGLVLSRKGDKVIVQGLNMRKKHVKASQDSKGGILELEAPIHISNLKACTAAQAPGEAFNIAGGKAHTILDLVEMLNRLIGTKIPPTLGPPRPGDVKHTRADIGKARRLLGWEPAVSFEEGLRRTVEHYRQPHTTHATNR